ncbi:hypothetical protein JCM1840_006946 [Sporobolomyces johnsonii]
MSRLLTQLDSNLPSHSVTPASSDSDQAPSPSKDKPDRIREWTFPRSTSASSLTSPSTGPAPGGTTTVRVADLAHGRSSSIAPGAAAKASSSSSPTKPTTTPVSATGPSDNVNDLRHRTAFSLSHGPGTPDLSLGGGGAGGAAFSTLPTQPREVVRMVYSNVRRRSLHDILYLVVFGGALFLFASALLGIGHDGAAGKEELMGRTDYEAIGKAPVVDVQIAKGFLPNEGDEGDVPADVHQPFGDHSHDAGEELMRDSPDDPALDDENVHNVYHPPSDSALFPHVDDPSDLDDPSLHDPHTQPRPARLPVHELERERPAHDHDGIEEHELLEEEEEEDANEQREEEVDDDEHAAAGPHEHPHPDADAESEAEVEVEVEEEEEGEEAEDEETEASDVDALEPDDSQILVDDSIGLHVVDADASDSLSALEELLDASSAEASEDDDEAPPLTPEEQDLVAAENAHRRAADLGGVERIKREREELARQRERWTADIRHGRQEGKEGRRVRMLR